MSTKPGYFDRLEFLYFDNTVSISIDIVVTEREWPKRTGLIKVRRDPDDMLPTPVAIRQHVAVLAGGPEWPRYRPSTSSIVMLVVAYVLALPSIIMLGWIIAGGVP